MSDNKPLISVIVPNYNHELYLKKRLDSIFSQSYSNFEVILLDDCSTDNSRVILSEYAKNDKVSHCVFNTINTGNTFVQWNRGIALAEGKFIWIAESDDFCDSNFLELVSKPLLLDEEITLSYCQSNRVDSRGRITGSWKEYSDELCTAQFENDFLMQGNQFIEEYLIHKNVIPNASAVVLKKENLRVSKELIDSGNLKYCGDWIIYFQHIINKKISFVAKSLNNFRYHSNSVIAIASKFERKISIIDIDIQMRKVMLQILKLNSPVNCSAIAKSNMKIIKGNNYEKSLILFNNGQKWKAVYLVIANVDEFVKKYPFYKRFNLKLKNIFL